jgi:tRNA (mo5U34)-methyltransferase
MDCQDGDLPPFVAKWIPIGYLRRPSQMPDSRGTAALRSAISQHFWWHSIDLGNGIVTPGQKTPESMAIESKLYFDGVDLTGRSVLDVGTWNGGFAVDVKRRGAARVLATDSHCWRDPYYKGRATFDLAIPATGLDIEAREIDATEVSVEAVGRFDVVLFLGVFYHLFDPISTLKQLAAVSGEMLIVETHLDAQDILKPAMIMYPGTELAQDPTNWWGPNRACMEALLRTVGFPRVTFQRGAMETRGVFHAWKA